MGTYGEWIAARGFTDDTIRARLTFYRAREREWSTWPRDAETLSRWLASYSGWTRLTYHSHLTSIYVWLLEEGRIERSPMVGIKRPPMPRPQPRPLADDELTMVLEAAAPRTRSFLMLGYLAGFRAMEIAKMHGRDITEELIHVVGKGGTDEWLPTHPLLWELAQSYPCGGYWFPPLTRRVNEHIQPETVTYHVGRLFRSLGLAGATHRARHTYGTRLLRGGANVRVVQELLRHRSLETTQRYLGVDEDERRAAVRRLAA